MPKLRQCCFFLILLERNHDNFRPSKLYISIVNNSIMFSFTFTLVLIRLWSRWPSFNLNNDCTNYHAGQLDRPKLTSTFRGCFYNFLSNNSPVGIVYNLFNHICTASRRNQIIYLGNWIKYDFNKDRLRWSIEASWTISNYIDSS